MFSSCLYFPQFKPPFQLPPSALNTVFDVYKNYTQPDGSLQFKRWHCEQQPDGDSCGVFAIANCCFLADNNATMEEVATYRFWSDSLSVRYTLHDAIEKAELTPNTFTVLSKENAQCLEFSLPAPKQRPPPPPTTVHPTVDTID